MDHKEVRGLISAVVTPFKADGSIDCRSFANHVERVASPKGIYGIAVSGHAGDARKAKEIHNKVAVPLMDAIDEYQLQKSPISTCGANKEALVQLGEIQSSWVRPPALGVDAARKAAIRAGLQKAGLLMAKSAVGM